MLILIKAEAMDGVYKHHYPVDVFSLLVYLKAKS